MSLHRTLLILTGAVVLSLSAFADNFEALRLKASRYVEQREWLNASAMYWLMLDQRPDDSQLYADAMISNSLTGDTAAVVTLVHSAMENLVNPDTLFANVRARSFALDCPTVYKDLLTRARDNFPWMTRMVDRNLLDYYDYRNDGPQMVKYADRMLQGFPENITYLRVKARGSLLCGDDAQATRVWKHILDIAPDNYDTLIDISAYYVAGGNHATAVPYIRRAMDIRSTPYLRSLLDQATK